MKHCTVHVNVRLPGDLVARLEDRVAELRRADPLLTRSDVIRRALVAALEAHPVLTAK